MCELKKRFSVKIIVISYNLAIICNVLFKKVTTNKGAGNFAFIIEIKIPSVSYLFT